MKRTQVENGPPTSLTLSKDKRERAFFRVATKGRGGQDNWASNSSKKGERLWGGHSVKDHEIRSTLKPFDCIREGDGQGQRKNPMAARYQKQTITQLTGEIPLSREQKRPGANKEDNDTSLETRKMETQRFIFSRPKSRKGQTND